MSQFRIFVRVQRNDWPTNLSEIHAPFSASSDFPGSARTWRFTVIGGSGQILEADWRRESNKLRRAMWLPLIEEAA